MTDKERYKEFKLTDNQKNLQNRTVDLIFDLLMACMMELQEDGADGNIDIAGSVTVNAAVRGVLFFASTVYGCTKNLKDHEQMTEARQAAYEYVKVALDHAHSSASNYHKGSLN